MELLEKKLNDIRDQLLKAMNVLPSPKAPTAPGIKTAAPVSKKSPLNVAQQMQNPANKKAAVKTAKEIVKVGHGGQWKLDKTPGPV